MEKNYNRELWESEEWRTAFSSWFLGYMVCPCRAIAPIVEELANEYEGKIVVGKCDVEENDDIAMEFGIRNIPTILFIKNGEVVDKFVGATTKAKLQEKFESLL